MQLTAGAPSSEQKNPVTASFALKLKVKMPSLLFVISTVAVVTGGVVSIVHVKLAMALTLPARSVALVLKVCGPFPSEEYVIGLVQLSHAPVSIWHCKVVFDLLTEIVNVFVVWLVGPLLLTADAIVTTGMTVSMVQENDLPPVGSGWPTLLLAITVKTWVPFARPV